MELLIASQSFLSGISPEMIPLLLTFATLFFYVAAVLYIAFTSITLSSGENSKQGDSGIPKDFREQFINAYNKVFSTFNMKPMEDMLTEFMHYSTLNTVKVLEKLGIKKEVTVKFDPEFDKYKGLGLVIKDGKNDMALDVSKCDYIETYSDERTNKKLYRRVLKKASYNIEFLKSNQQLESDIKHCMNCGDVLTRSGNFFDCKSCGAHYDSELLRWSASNVTVEPNSQPASNFMFVLVLGLVILGLAEMITKNKALGLAIIGIDIFLIVIGVLYFGWVIKSIQPYKQMAAHDPKSSRMVFNKRVYYLIRTLEMARDFDLTMIKPFMKKDLYDKIKQNNEYDDYYVVDLTFKQIIPLKYRIEGENQIIEFKVKYDQLLMNPRKKIKHSTQKRRYAFYKNINAMTKINASAQAIVCPGCGANINLTTEGICTYCNASYDVANFDWIFYDAPIEMTK